MVQTLLPERLRILRAREGWTLTEAAERIGVRMETLSDLEHGKRRAYLPTIHKIAEGYSVPVEDLLESDEPPKDEAPRSLAGELEELRREGKLTVSIRTDDPDAEVSLQDLNPWWLVGMLKAARDADLGPGDAIQFYVEVRTQAAEEPVPAYLVVQAA